MIVRVEENYKSNLGSDDVIWKQFAELGWLGLPFAEKDGGFGGDFMDLHILMESFGKGLVIEPYISTVILSGSVLSLCPDSKIRSQIINNIIEGKTKYLLHMRNLILDII